jgi:hypothetical protein
VNQLDLAGAVVDTAHAGLVFARELVALRRQNNLWKGRYERAKAAAKHERARRYAERIARAAEAELERRRGKS